jgi:hypothetical protein
MLLDILDDIFLLNLPLEPAKGAFDRLAFLDLHFRQTVSTPFYGPRSLCTRPANWTEYARLSQQRRILGIKLSASQRKTRRFG